jgi:RND family efflux transporter MFP subunit
MEKKNLQKIIGIVLGLVVLAIVAGVVVLSQKKPQQLYAFITPNRGDLLQEVKVSGKVKAAQNVDLSFQVGGKVAKTYVKVGDRVTPGQLLVELINADVRADMAQTSAGVAMAKAQLQQFEASLALQKVKKIEMLKGARPEEVGLTQTLVANAQKTLADAEVNLANVKNRATVDLHNVQNIINNILTDAYTKANDAVNRQTSNLFQNSQSVTPKLILNTALDSSVGPSAELARPSALLAVSKLQSLSTAVNSDFSNATEVVSQTNGELQTVWNYLNTLTTAINSSVASVETSQTALDNYRNNINTAMSAINSVKTVLTNYSQGVNAVVSGNTTAVQQAEIAVTNSRNALNVANDSLRIKREGATAEQLASQDALIAQAEAALSVQRAQIMSVSASAGKSAAQLDKFVIKAPMAGQVTVLKPKVGEVVSPSQPIVSVMSVAKYQIETFVTEADLTKLQLGSIADVTLDSYGASKHYQAKVILIDPAATIIKNNTTYKVTLEFTKEDLSIKADMTANLEIIVEQVKNTLIIPESAMIKEGSEHFVIVDNKTITGERRNIKVGLVTEDGHVSVTSGLVDGEKIADFSALSLTK